MDRKVRPKVEDGLAWTRRSVAFNFSFGDLTWLRVRRRGLTTYFDLDSIRTWSASDREFLESYPPDADVVFVASLPVRGELPRMSRVSAGLRYVANQYPRYFVDLTSSFDTYLGRFSSKSRSTLQRKVKKYAEYTGERTPVRVYRTQDELAEFRTLAAELSSQSYQERLHDKGLPRDDAYWHDVFARSSRGEIFGFILFAKSAPAAYMLCPINDGVAIYEHLGYAPDYGHLSPGTVLQYHALACLFAEPAVRAFDFTQGGGEHKRFFASASVHCVDVYYFPYRLNSVLLAYSHAGIDSLSTWLGTTLERFGLKARVRRWLRTR